MLVDYSQLALAPGLLGATGLQLATLSPGLLGATGQLQLANELQA